MSDPPTSCNLCSCPLHPRRQRVDNPRPTPNPCHPQVGDSRLKKANMYVHPEVPSYSLDGAPHLPGLMSVLTVLLRFMAWHRE